MRGRDRDRPAGLDARPEPTIVFTVGVTVAVAEKPWMLIAPPVPLSVPVSASVVPSACAVTLFVTSRTEPLLPSIVSVVGSASDSASASETLIAPPPSRSIFAVARSRLSARTDAESAPAVAPEPVPVRTLPRSFARVMPAAVPSGSDGT